MGMSIQGPGQFGVGQRPPGPPPWIGQTIEQGSASMITRFDTNSDGAVTLASEGANNPLLAAIDAAGTVDGSVTAAEAQSFATKYDANADGTLSRDEFIALATGIGLPAPPQGGFRPGGKGGVPGQFPGAPGQFGGTPPPRDIASMPQHLISRLDADGDGAISLANELTGAGQARHSALLAAADTDANGLVTGAELTAQLTAADTDGDGAISRTEMQALRVTVGETPLVQGGGVAGTTSVSTTGTPTSGDSAAIVATLRDLMAQIQALLARYQS